MFNVDAKNNNHYTNFDKMLKHYLNVST